MHPLGFLKRMRCVNANHRDTIYRWRDRLQTGKLEGADSPRAAEYPAARQIMVEQPSAEDIQALLVRRIATGDLQAVSDFYDQTARPLFSVALRILGDKPEAEEVIQDVFVQLWEKAAMFDPILGSAFHWALSITRHRAIDRLRSRQRRAKLADQLLESSDAAEAEASAVAPDSEAVGAEEAAAVRAALVGLPKDQRQAIEMAFFGGLTHPEIAEALNEPLGTIKARIRRGLLKLRESLQTFG
jgi:RNA polymerase sigma-70 factor (ECF subfamily)